MRSIWKGSIAFGGVAIPVKAYPATEEHSSGLHQAHQHDGGRVRIKRVCEIDDAEVPFPEVVKGFELPGGDVVLLTDDDLATLPLPTAQTIAVCAFTPLDQVDPIYSGKSYYLEPEPAGTKPYVLFSEALQQSGKVAVVKVALRQRESLAVLRVRHQVIVLETMLWADEIRTPDFPFQHEDVELSSTEINAAAGWMERLSRPFSPEQYTDSYAEALQALVQAKIEGAEVVAPTAIAQEVRTQDLLAALRSGAEIAEGNRPKPTRKPKPTRRRVPTPEPDDRTAAVRKAKAAERKAAAAKSTATRAADRARSLG